MSVSINSHLSDEAVAEQAAAPSFFEEFGLLEHDLNIDILKSIKVGEPRDITTRRGPTKVFDVRFDLDCLSRVTGRMTPLQGKLSVWRGTSKIEELDQKEEVKFWETYGHFTRFAGRPQALAAFKHVRENTYSTNKGKVVLAFSVESLDFITTRPEEYEALDLFRKWVSEQQQLQQDNEVPPDDEEEVF